MKTQHLYSHTLLYTLAEEETVDSGQTVQRSLGQEGLSDGVMIEETSVNIITEGLPFTSDEGGEAL